LILSIFNRWGEEVFRSNTIGEFWNGQIMNSGKIAPGGVYVYRITIISSADGTPLSKSGQVSLIR
jgi:hypothetical protein